MQFRPFCGKRIADAVAPPPPLGICGSIASAARIFLLALLLTLAGVFAVAIQSESAKPQNFAFANLLAAPAFAQSGIPNPDFPDPETISNSDITALGTDCSNAGGDQNDAQDLTSGEFALWCDLNIQHEGETVAGCFYQRHSNFDRNGNLTSQVAAGLPDCRGAIPFCPDSRKVPDLAGGTSNPFSECQACADFNRVDGNPECGICLANHAEDDEGMCRETMDCAAQNRFQPDAFTCGDCLTGFTEGAGSCQENQDCAAEGKVQTNAYTCGSCLPNRAVGSGGACECVSGFGEINGHCVHPQIALPENETTCDDIFGGDWVDLSAAHGAGKGVCSGIDINDTFCLTGTVSALPCLGLFNHVRSCNLLGRPALDPWHCAAACAGGKASGARCLGSE